MGPGGSWGERCTQFRRSFPEKTLNADILNLEFRPFSWMFFYELTSDKHFTFLTFDIYDINAQYEKSIYELSYPFSQQQMKNRP